MANQLSLSHRQVEAIDALFKKYNIGDSADALVYDFGPEVGVRLYQLAKLVDFKAKNANGK